MKTKRPYVISALMAMLVRTITACTGGLVGSKEEKLAYFDSLESETLARLVHNHTTQRRMLRKPSAID
ncbi:MAG TPA: hypothetical protein VF205_06910 [Nitrospiraceae bacterium]